MKPVQGPIALVTPQLVPGGAERYVVSLARRLAMGGDSVCVLSSGGAMQSELNVPHVRVPIHRRDPLSAVRSAVAVSGVRPVLVHANSLNAAIAGQWVRRMRATPVVLTGHGWPGRDMVRVARLAARMCDSVVAVSDYVGRELIRAGFPRERLEVIHHGVDTRTFKPAADRTNLRRRLGFGNERVVLYLGRLEPEKGFDVLLTAWDIVAAHASNIVLLVAGDGTLRSLLDRARPAVRYLGQRSDVADLLGATDVLVLPSRYEALGMAALEALACAVPIVASEVGGISEVVDDEVGRLVPPGVPSALATAILQLAGSPEAASMAANAVARAQQAFSLDRMVERTQAVYSRLRRSKEASLR